MFKIDGDTIFLTRGDKCSFNFILENYTFVNGDYVKFKVYKRSGLDLSPLIEKKVEATEGTNSIEIQLSSDETKIGELTNKSNEYWYEIELNGNQTILGFDENGAKRLILYPEGADNNA